MLKLLIAEGNDELRQALKEQLHSSYILKTCANGQQVRDILTDFAPDLWVLDLTLPMVDGITLLQEAANAGLRSVTLVTLTYQSPYITGALEKFEVAYVMSKPCAVDAVAAQLQALSALVQQDSCPGRPLSYGLSSILLELGLSPKVDGYSYLMEALPRYAADPCQGLTKELYSAVGHYFQKSGPQVERSIRTAIQSAWYRSSGQGWSRYFPTAPDGTVPRPTNGEFIARISALLQQNNAEHSA